VLSKLNRYELIMNGKCIYSGINQEFQVIMLKPDTEYKFEVCVHNTLYFKSYKINQLTFR